MNNVLDFINHVDNTCKAHNIKFILSPRKELNKSTGYFNGRRLVVCVNHPMEVWLETLLHEYGHLEQDIENVHQISTDIFTWLKHQKRHTSTLYKIRDMELDCERRSVKNIDRFNLPIKKMDYAKRAGAYIHYYNYMLINPTWPKKSPSTIDEIVQRMPNSLRGTFEKLGSHEKVYRKYYG